MGLARHIRAHTYLRRDFRFDRFATDTTASSRSRICSAMSSTIVEEMNARGWNLSSKGTELLQEKSRGNTLSVKQAEAILRDVRDGTTGLRIPA